ncbi:MAG TPA: DUF2306 domain-containing protein [Candidatus Acidoferrum sp.]|nr:DUF2306 domain-containing protein [Candidatus Acidoferrum sp.]
MASSATLPGSTPAKSSSRTITIVLLLIASAVAARFIWHYAVPYFLHFNQQQFDVYGYWPHRFRLITHIGGGMLALTCGTLQLWTGLRQRAMNFHRWTGRVYLVGAALGITGAFLMAVYTTPRSFGVGLMALASAWITTTAIAWAAILRGRVEMHKEWMMRSYLVGFAFVTFRIFTDLLPGVTKHLGSNIDDASTSVSWLSWVLPLAIYEVILQARKLNGSAA